MEIQAVEQLVGKKCQPCEGGVDPCTLAEAEQQLAMGEADVLSGRTGDAPVRAGQAALEAFLRSVEIAALADSVGRRAINVETLVLAHEDDLASLAAAAGFEAQGGKTEQTTEQISAEIRRLQSEVDRLTVELSSTSEAASQLSDRVTILEGRLTESEEKFTDVRNELLDRQQREDRLREAQGLFLPGEGEVFLAGNRFVLRLFGLTFESGSSEILEEHHALLMKVQRVITTFEGASVRIEGHTDAQGGEEGNQRLSQRRAIAVREHLLARIPIPSSRVEALGLGEAQPIGSNETEEGRARNRRIEVVLDVTASASSFVFFTGFLVFISQQAPDQYAMTTVPPWEHNLNPSELIAYHRALKSGAFNGNEIEAKRYLYRQGSSSQLAPHHIHHPHLLWPLFELSIFHLLIVPS
mgnify:CR=1 FL=1